MSSARGSLGTSTSLTYVRESRLTKRGALSKHTSFQSVVKKLHPKCGESILSGRSQTGSRYKSRYKQCPLCRKWFILRAYIQHARGIREIDGVKSCAFSRVPDKGRRPNEVARKRDELSRLRRLERAREMEEAEAHRFDDTEGEN